ncbi:hypothetical protein CRI93_04780 [Longimonas halophila]|uniref:Uncharacterized protein n=1 Tax=Longimonas halophila TaxID=1469170 RepID=A0A2H3P939_9BACT|nr:hypothetical protein [Longimonas halophila]PEN08431.1 hypothetical protein CRI93_04780 [Longimonas halophila]
MKQEHVIQDHTQDPYYRPDSKHVLSKETFDREWRKSFESIFKSKGGPSNPRWLPDRVFESGFRYCFIINDYYLLRRDYQKTQRALHELGESEFVIIGAEKQFGTRNEDRRLIYKVNLPWKDYIQGKKKDVSSFFLVVQPTEFYLHGQRDDWGIVASEDLGIAVVGCRGKKASRVFRERFITDPQIIRQEHLLSTPDNYRTAFERNYLSSVL